jgi:hypothetical protein
VALNPSRFWTFGDMLRFLARLLPGLNPETALLTRLDFAADLGLPPAWYKSLCRVKTNRTYRGYANNFRDSGGRRNGVVWGSEPDEMEDYDKIEELTYRHPEMKAILADVVWSRDERSLTSAAVLPVKTLAEIPDLVNFNPFTVFRHELVETYADRVNPRTCHRWRTVLKKLHRFDCIAEREGLTAAIRELNAGGHLGRLKAKGYVNVQPLTFDFAADWRACLEDYVFGDDRPSLAGDFDDHFFISSFL